MWTGWPELDLELEDPEAKLPGQLPVDDPLYPVAAWAYHHGDALPPRLRRGLYAALEGGWPGDRGRRRTRRFARSMVAHLREAGVPVAVIARGLEKSEKEVNELLRESRQNSDEGLRQPRVVPNPPDLKPYDPADGVSGEIYARGPRYLSKNAVTNDIALANKLAHELGFRSLQELSERGFSNPSHAPREGA